MQIVIKYVKRGKDDRERTRTDVVKITRANPGWYDYASTAMVRKREGERIVSIAEGGYH